MSTVVDMRCAYFPGKSVNMWNHPKISGTLGTVPSVSPVDAAVLYPIGDKSGSAPTSICCDLVAFRCNCIDECKDSALLGTQ